MRILTAPARAELTVKNSRFLSELLPCGGQAEARALIKSQKEKYSDASHVVHAFVLGGEGEILGMSDAGEPSGTAGRPVLDALRGRGCTDTLLTVTRWFGGTLLGTGGLVKAYGESARLVLDAAEASGLFAGRVPTEEFSFCADYSAYRAVRNAMAQFAVSDVREQFGVAVSVSGRVRADEYAAFAARLRDLSAGGIDITR